VLMPTGADTQQYQMPNSSSISEFLLLALADTRQLQLLHFWLFLGISLAALLGNGLSSTAAACDHGLHTPMDFFLLNLTPKPTVMFAYLKPSSVSSASVDLVVALLYSVVPPTGNPSAA
ncbi:hypothetical protein ASZ78_002116, partial [Callipepla squamata]